MSVNIQSNWTLRIGFLWILRVGLRPNRSCEASLRGFRAVLRLTTGGHLSHLIFCNRCFRSSRWPFRNDRFETKDHISWPDVPPVIQVIDYWSIKCPEIWEPTFSISQSSVDDLRDIHQKETNNMWAKTSILDAYGNPRVWWKNIPDCPACGLFPE
jgi:hypothetical protein